MTRQTNEQFHERFAWLLPASLGLLLSLSALVIVVGGANPPAQFETDTGVPWADFARDYPTVATLVSLQELLIGTGFLGFALLVTLIASTKLRGGDRWAWYVLWILPGVLAVATVLFSTHKQEYVAAFYGVFAILAALGLVLPARRFLRRG